MSPSRRGSGPAPARAEPAPQITSRHQEVGIETETSGGDRQGEADDFAIPPPIPYGRDYLDTDLWLDRDGTVYTGAGPYQHRPLRRLRRALRWWVR